LRRILLFDIDNTLLWSGGAGGLAMKIAFRDMFGIDNGFARVEFDGRTDRYILAEALRQHGIGGDEPTLLSQFQDRYHALLADTLCQRQGHLMPGFPQLLEALSRYPDLSLGLATGNFRQGARLKLVRYGLDHYFSHYFSIGVFGEESEDRAEVVRLAIERTAAGVPPKDILIIGDTPHDISSALANGVVAVTVATGRYGVDELYECGAHLVFPDFADWREAAAMLLGQA